MKHLATLLVAVLFFATTVAGIAQESPADWAGKLGSGNYAEREKAAKALEKLGSAALPALRAALAHADLETKRRAILLMERIEDRLIVEELMTATPVRLQFQDVPVKDALPDVGNQMGLLFGNVTSSKRITLDTGSVPYWQAWRKFCVAAQLEERDMARLAAKLRRVREHDVDQLVRMLGRGQMDRPSPFLAPRVRFAASPLTDRYTEDDRHSVRVRMKWHALDELVQEKNTHGIFAIEVAPEPRLEVATLPIAEITKIVDDQGNARTVQAARMFPEIAAKDSVNFLYAYTGEIQYGGYLQLKAIPLQGPSRHFKEVHGHVRLEVRARSRMMEMPGVLKSIGKEMRGDQGITVRILAAEADDEGDVHLRLRLDHLDSLMPKTAEEQIVRVRPGVIAVRGAMDVALERLELMDAQGRKCRQIKGRYEQASAGKGYEADLVFAAPLNKPEALTLVMMKAPRTVPLEIPFLVRDVAWAEKKAGK